MVVTKKLSGGKIIFSLLLMLVVTHCKAPVLEQHTSIKSLVVEYRSVNTIQDIREITDSLVVPVIYNEVISLNHLPIDLKKKKFIDMMLPAVLYAKYNMDQLNAEMDDISYKIENNIPLTKEESEFLNQTLKDYRARDIYELKEKLITHPVSLVLAQAAIESGWGTSRFFLEGNNVFGIWSYDPAENRMMAKSGREGRNIFLRKYDHISGSIVDYFNTVARAKAYTGFRKVRANSDNVFEMANYLNKYSELGYEYVSKIKYIIKSNDLTRYDHYQIDPNYFIETPVSEEPLLVMR